MRAPIACFYAIWWIVQCRLGTSAQDGDSQRGMSDSYTEELYFRPLIHERGVVSFDFHIQAVMPAQSADARTSWSHFDLFPKILGQIYQQSSLRSMTLKFTQGRWNLDHWGEPIAEASPGVVIATEILANTREEADQKFLRLKQTLSGIFCASLNLLEKTRTANDRNLPLFHANNTRTNSVKIFSFYGVLPREAVCTENLTPWLKLLPCRHHRGFSTLIHPQTIYRSEYHSMTVTINHEQRLPEIGVSTEKIHLHQTLTYVTPGRDSKSSDWLSLWSMTNPRLSPTADTSLSACPLASASVIKTERGDSALMNEEWKAKFQTVPGPSQWWADVEGNNSEVKMAISKLNLNHEDAVDVKSPWVKDWIPARALNGRFPFKISRFLTGAGQAHGGLAISFENRDTKIPVEVSYFDMIPWFLRVYFHTMHASLNGRHLQLSEAFHFVKVNPAADRGHPATFHLKFILPPASRLLLSMNAEKAFLLYRDFPPDANRGFDINAAIVEVSKNTSGLGKTQISFATEPLLVLLPTPDFTMPYNVITLTSTVIAFTIGTLLNALTRKPLPTPLDLAIKEREQSLKGPKRLSLLARLRSKFAAKPKMD